MYLISQFLVLHTNRRKDEYGGSLRNRMRLPLEILSAVRKRVGDDFPVIAKVNGTDWLMLRKGTKESELLEFGLAMADQGLDAIEISRAHYESLPPMMSGSYRDWTSTQVHHGVGRKFSPDRQRFALTIAPVMDAISEWVAPKKASTSLLDHGLSHKRKSDAIGGQIECKHLVKCNANEWSVPMQSGGQMECNFATGQSMLWL